MSRRAGVADRRTRAGLAAVLVGLTAAGAALVSAPRILRDTPVSPAQQRPTILADDALMLDAGPGAAAATAATMRRLGADWVRIGVDWSRLAPDREALHRSRSWTALDRAARAARAHEMRVLLELGGRVPGWAVDRRGAVDASEYAAFAAAVAQRYSGRRPGLPPAAAFTLAAPGAPAMNPDRYRALLHAAHPPVAGAAPGSLVLIGASASPAALDFTRKLACVSLDLRPLHTPACARFRPLPGDGWAHRLEAVGAPPWQPAPDPDAVGPASLSRLTTLLKRLRAAGRVRRALPVYVTTAGYDAGAPSVGLYRQGRWLAEAERLARLTPGVRSFAHGPLRDRGGTSAGLLLADGRPKPAAGAFAFPLVVRRAGPERVLIWGRVRPHAHRGRFRISVRSPGGDWQPLPQFNRPRHTSDGGYLAVEARTAFGGVPVDPSWDYRLELFTDEEGWRAAGLPVMGAR